MPALSFSELVKHYAGSKRQPPKHALKGIDLEIPRGSFFGLLGPNGAGKSTLINIMSGLVMKTRGTVVVDGHDIDTHSREAKLSLGVVPQELVVDTFFTVREALEIHAGYYAVPKSRRRTQEIIDALGLTQQADMNSRRLSGGMRRRLLIAKALVHQPAILVLDEPTAGVDVELREQLWNYVRELNASGTTILLTTHYLEEAQTLCDQIAIINHGTLVAHDSTRALMSRVDSKEMTFTFASPLQALPPTLAALNANVHADGRLSIRYQPSNTPLAQMLDTIRAHTPEVVDISIKEPALEDVFRQLTHP
jgi:ABC-2 type transport system ATP-binding protein